MSPDEPMTPLTEAATGMHELFSSLIGGGFTELQAIQIIANVLFLHTRSSSDDDST